MSERQDGIREYCLFDTDYPIFLSENPNGCYGEYADSQKGCEKFESCGMPAHPNIVKILLENNPLTIEIPIYPQATESGYDLIGKRNEYTRKHTNYPEGRSRRE